MIVDVSHRLTSEMGGRNNGDNGDDDNDNDDDDG